MTDRTQAMTELAPGCCSASLPCNFQKEFPRLICDSCQIASLSSQLEESRKLCTAFEEAVGEDVGAILALKARIHELEASLSRYQDGMHEWRRRAELAETKLVALPPRYIAP